MGGSARRAGIHARRRTGPPSRRTLSGVARALMLQLELDARRHKFSLLLLDTCKGSAAEKLYASMGWQRVGEVPRFAYNPDGSMCDTVFYYKEL